MRRSGQADPEISAPVAAAASGESRFMELLLHAERVLRQHPAAVGVFTVASVAAIAVGHLRGHSDLPLALTYAFPIAVCTYVIGVAAGVITAAAIAVLWFLEALSRGVGNDEAALILSIRLFSNLVIVALAAVVAAAARTRERYLEAQRELESLRGDLVAAFSHDLRSPLAAIVGHTELLREDVSASPNGVPVETLDRILANANRLDNLIGEMLVAGRGESDAPVQWMTVEPEALIVELRAEIGHRRRHSGVELRWQVEPQTPPMHTDRAKVLSIVRNLVNNALKFTDAGSVTVRIGYDPSAQAHRIEVEDTGAGIPPQALPKVFDRFYRARGVEKLSGFGLGLFIVKRFTDLLGGSLAARSEVGRGTCFTVILPGPAASAEPSRDAEPV